MTKGTPLIYPLSALRALVLHTQLLSTPQGAAPLPTPQAMLAVVKALGYLQMDTLQVVNRAHYITLWARLGGYPLDDLHRLVYSAGQRQLYEGWGHAASLIPLEHYRYHRWRSDPNISHNPGFRAWLSQSGHQEQVEQTLARIRATERGLRVGDFEDPDGPRGAWYDWRPSKTALEVLFARAI
ncbi:MAG: hypothetical protein HC915_20130 [Anaerolineae bacterium]|nr:hypothetical protein [Anaerolineae bacterium]